MSQENVDTVRRSLDAWNRDDVDGWLEAAHPEIEWYSEVARQVEGAETVYRGRLELRRFWDDWRAVWNVTIDVTDTHDFGDSVIAVANLRARGEASGISLELPIAYLFEFEGALARRAHAYLDPQQAFEAVGARD